MLRTQKVLNAFHKHWKGLLLLLLSFLILGVLLWRVHTLEKELDNKTQQITVMKQEQAENLNSLRNQLGLNKQNAEFLKEKIIASQHGLRQPETSYKEILRYGDSSVKVIEKKLATGDSTLPTEALEKSDKTVVVEQKDNHEFPIGIYKINTYRNWEAGLGFGYHKGDKYIPFSIQRNYDKQHSVMFEGHYDIDKKKVNGEEVQWKIHF